MSRDLLPNPRLGLAWAERMAKFMFRAAQCASRLGFWRALIYLVRSRQRGCFALTVPGLAFPVYLRGGSSDVGIFESIFFRNVYPPPRSLAPMILDLGANVGYASLFFVLNNPQARILAVEPEPENFELLTRNTGPYPNIARCQVAAWSEATTLYLEPGAAYSDPITRDAPLHPHGGATAVSAYSIPELLDRAGFSRVDLVKMDVEGAEAEIFSKNTADWLPRVRELYIETHDRFAPGASRAVFNALNGRNFSVELSGENLLISIPDPR